MKRAFGRGLPLALAFSLAAAFAADADPPVPPGRDGGGTPIAILCRGLDYTPEAFAARLARDGEGEIIGYDYLDDDRRPYAKNEAGAQSMAEIILGEGQTTSLVVLRADTGDMLSLSHALIFASKSPARIIVIDGVPRDRAANAALASAVRHFHDRLFIIGAGDDDRDLDQDWSATLRDLPNLLIVSPTAAAGRTPPGANTGPLTIDIATSGAPLKGEESAQPDMPGASMRAAGHIAALAARLRAVEPSVPASAMKVRITAFATKSQDAASPKTVHGVIERPERYFWLE